MLHTTFWLIFCWNILVSARYEVGNHFWGNRSANVDIKKGLSLQTPAPDRVNQSLVQCLFLRNSVVTFVAAHCTDMFLRNSVKVCGCVYQPTSGIDCTSNRDEYQSAGQTREIPLRIIFHAKYYGITGLFGIFSQMADVRIVKEVISCDNVLNRKDVVL